MITLSGACKFQKNFVYQRGRTGVFHPESSEQKAHVQQKNRLLYLEAEKLSAQPLCFNSGVG